MRTISTHDATVTRDCTQPLCVNEAERGSQYCRSHKERPLTRVEKAALIRQAKIDYPDVTDAERAAMLGMSIGGYRGLVTDPDGSKQRARRETYKGVCERCGGETKCDGTKTPTTKYCRDCAEIVAHEERTWTPEAIIACFKEFYEVNGQVPTASDPMVANPSFRKKLSPERVAEAEAMMARVRLPFPSAVRREFGTWKAAVESAGLEPAGNGGSPYHRVIPKRVWTAERIIEAIRQHVIDNGRPPRARDWESASVDGSRPVTVTVKKRFVTWNAAIKSAGFEPTKTQRSHPREITFADTLRAEIKRLDDLINTATANRDKVLLVLAQVEAEELQA